MEREELKKILADHAKWLLGDENGVRAHLEGADLKGADLKGANLRVAYLGGADLEGADLWRANLEGANLRLAYLEGADLWGANLEEANLWGANLKGANLEEANLWGANLEEANLWGANLKGANLEEANLWGANLVRAANIPYDVKARLMVCPEEGSFIGWKKIITKNGDRIVKLQITENAKRSSATTRKCRCSEAKVLEIQNIDGSKAPETKIAHFVYEHVTRYAVGEMVYPDAFDEDRWVECSNGIHFFITRFEAVDY